MLKIGKNVTLPESELDIQFIRASGPGGQKVNKTASAVHLRFNIHASSLPQRYKDRLLALRDQRITTDGEIVIKAQEYRSREKNLAAAMTRLVQLLKTVMVMPKKRIATRPGRAARERRMDDKQHRGKIKSWRGKVTD